MSELDFNIPKHLNESDRYGYSKDNPDWFAIHQAVDSGRALGTMICLESNVNSLVVKKIVIEAQINDALALAFYRGKISMLIRVDLDKETLTESLLCQCNRPIVLGDDE